MVLFKRLKLTFSPLGVLKSKTLLLFQSQIVSPSLKHTISADYCSIQLNFFLKITTSKVSFSCFVSEKNFSDSQYHFLFTSDGHQCATMLIESATTRGFPGEADLFVAQAVFQ